ncbi:MAG: 3-oxoacyl-[acyl-carrier protein] reductase (EC [uncultured Aureispira sp.]|uniref:3-oxoacyl-[acyl-carrier protein] reductase (EC) n=1 Tax=uncultured Aureispira sp. TaxID=1331704 RepID=A0A6S6TWG1_9BACT|nr:MAG: 3-oxoacyl-[acyl-carrier protein] reductase (EC [uncultured Aureispira sp.]
MIPTEKIYPCCEIKAGEIILDGKVLYENKELPFPKFIKGAYKALELNYPKFHKMDRLCKLAFVAANALLKEGQLEGYAPSDIGIVMANSKATLHTDSKYADSIKDRADYFPSPAVFVYTLPNIMVGEICIKYKIKGESVFFVSNTFDKKMLTEYSQDMIETGNAKICLMGWVDYTDTDYHAILYLIQ